MVLSDGKKGDIFTVQSIQTDLKIKNRLQDMGLTKDVRIKILAYYSKNAYIVSIRGSRVVLAKVIAAKIEVVPIPQQEAINNEIEGDLPLGHCS